MIWRAFSMAKVAFQKSFRSSVEPPESEGSKLTMNRLMIYASLISQLRNLSKRMNWALRKWIKRNNWSRLIVIKMRMVPAILTHLRKSLENLTSSILSLSTGNSPRKVRSPRIYSNKPQMDQARIVLLTRLGRVERTQTYPKQVLSFLTH